MIHKVKKYSILIIAAVLLVVLAFAGAVSADTPTASGDCGKDGGANLHWAYYDSTKTLEITGSGEMKDWDPSAYDFAPWHEDYRGLITSVKLPSGLKNIGTYAFYQCTAITSIEIPASVTTIGEGAFQESALTSIEIPTNVKTIGKSAFYKCEDLETVTFAKGSKLTTISDQAFCDCYALKSIVIPANVKIIGANAFYECEDLETVTFAEGSRLTTIDYGAFQYSALASIEIPASVTTIGSYAFYNCEDLETVTFADVSKLTSIGDGAFSSCSLKKVTINAGKFSSNPNPFGDNVFLNTDLGCVISKKLQDTAVMDKFIDIPPGMVASQVSAENSGDNPVWYISEKTDSLTGYDDYFIGRLNGGTLKANFVQEIDSSNIYILPIADDVTRKGYAFDKWVNNGDEVTTLTDCWMNATLKWTPVIYTITYIIDGGTNHADNPTTYTIESEDITLQDATWDGYTFDGWYEDESFTTEITGIPKGSTGDMVLYAKWTPLATGHSPSLPKEYTTPSYVPPMVQETVQPTAAPTPTPAAPTMMPTSKPTTQATQKSPVPFAGLIAGLGVAALLIRMRK